ncbi:MAG: phage tail protein [Lachnospiraceae bacterium]|nr:phage tail protein [Lachnospiraceae bacterium]
MSKIKYGLSNVYYAVATDDGNGNLTYAAPVAWKGAVSLSLDAQGETNTFYADNIAYFVSNANSGYQGDFESALIPDSFRTSVLGEVLDAKGFYVEKAEAPTVEFALLFQFENDDHNTRHCLYRCTASRPQTSGSTQEASIEPQTETITITAMPRVSDHVIKSRAPYTNSTSSAYYTWFSTVSEPTTTP